MMLFNFSRSFKEPHYLDPKMLCWFVWLVNSMSNGLQLSCLVVTVGCCWGLDI